MNFQGTLFSQNGNIGCFAETIFTIKGLHNTPEMFRGLNFCSSEEIRENRKHYTPQKFGIYCISVAQLELW